MKSGLLKASASLVMVISLFVSRPYCRAETTENAKAASADVREVGEADYAPYVEYLRQSAKSPVDYVVEKFNEHDVVILGEMHGIQENLRFVAALIEPLYHRAGVRCLATEFLRRRNTALANQIVTAVEYDEEKVIELYRDFAWVWGDKGYMDIFKAVWKLNRTLPPGAEKFMIIGLDGDIDEEDTWFGPRLRREYARREIRKRDARMAEVVSNEVLAKGKKALIHTGYNHSFTHYRQPGFEEGRIGYILHEKYGDRIFQICLHQWHYTLEEKPATAINSLLEKVFLANGSNPVGFDVVNSPFARLRDGESYYFANQEDVVFSDIARGYIFLKPFSEMKRQCTWVDGFIDESNFQKARAIYIKRGWIGEEEGNTPDELDQISKYCLVDNLALADALNGLKSPYSSVRKQMAWLLGKRIKDPGAVEPLIAALKDEDFEVRKNAAWALGKIKDTRAVQPLIAVLSDQEAKVRENAAWALKKITGEDFGEDAAAWRKWWEGNKAGKKDITEINFIIYSKIDKAGQYGQGKDVKVAVLDWFFNMSPEKSRKYVYPVSLVPGEPIGKDKPWHGEWMAEIVHTIAPEAKIIPIRARPYHEKGERASDGREVYEAYLAKGIRYAADHGAVAVTNSMGPVKQCEELRAAIDYAESKGTIFINVHPEYLEYSNGGYQWCKSDELDRRILHPGLVSVLEHHTKPEPFRDIYVWPYQINPVFEDGWGYSNGPPIVAGVAALMKSVNPALSPQDIRELVTETADTKDGFRVLNAEGAVLAALKKAEKSSARTP